MATHDMALAHVVGDRIVELCDGAARVATVAAGVTA
jgi:ABC-type polar amino acid transport system ATPase subunit